MEEILQKFSTLSPEKRALLELRLKQKKSGIKTVRMSFAQQRLWFIDQLEQGSISYNIPFAVRLKGKAGFNSLEKCITEIIKRHEILRTVFRNDNGQFLQVISDKSDFKLMPVELKGISSGERYEEIKEFINNESKYKFDLQNGPLIKAYLFDINEHDHVLFVLMHHIICDGWSVKIFVNEFLRIFEAVTAVKEVSLPELPIQYSDYALWQHKIMEKGTKDIQLKYWKEKLTPLPEPLELPADFKPSKTQSNNGDSVNLAISKELSAFLKKTAVQEGCTMYIVLLALYKALLFKYTGKTDIAVGSPVANRNRKEIEPLIGFFVNTIVLRTDLSGNPEFKDLIARVKKVALEAFSYEDMPFEVLVEELNPSRNTGRTPLFQTMFSYQKTTGEQIVKINDVTIEPIEIEKKTANFDILFSASEKNDDITLSIEFNTDLFTRETIERMAGHYVKIIEEAAKGINKGINDIDILTENEKQLLLEYSHSSRQTSKNQFRVRNIHKIFEAQVKRSPDAAAVKLGNEEISYKELNKRANEVSVRLRKAGVEEGNLIGLFLDRTIDMIAGVLGILKSGCAYVPLDPIYPKERLSLIVEDIASPVIITSRDLLAKLPECSSEILFMDEGITTEEYAAEDFIYDKLYSEDIYYNIDSTSNEQPSIEVFPSSTAYIIFTSGSTGRPKGVMVTHENVVRLFESTDHYFHFDHTDIWTMFHSIAFDFSVWEIYGALFYGGKVVIVPQTVSRNPMEFLKLLIDEKVTILNQTPAAFKSLSDQEQSIIEQTGRKEPLIKDLRLVIFGGDKLELQSLKPWIDLHGDVSPELVNMYGITETTVHVTYRRILREDTETDRGSLIGEPIEDLRIFILDSNLKMVPINIPGEICVSGKGISKGYLKSPDLTSQKFVPNPFSLESGEELYRSGDLAKFRSNGDIEYLGRIDHQVQLRGFRVELGEIENALLCHPAVKDAVVIDKDNNGDKILIAYITSQNGQHINSSEIKEHLGKQIPYYMLPSLIIQIDSIPLTAHGKVDRHALIEVSVDEITSEREYQNPVTSTEEMLSEIMADLLNRKRIGRKDDFFDLGGHSLLATQLRSRINNIFRIDIQLREIFENSSLEALSRKIDLLRQEASGVAHEHISAVPQKENLTLSYAQERLWFLEQLDPGNPSYNVPVIFKIEGKLDVILLNESINEIIRRHEILRTSFITVEGKSCAQKTDILTVNILVNDLSKYSEAEKERLSSEILAEEVQTPVDISKAPLFRFRLLKISEEEHIASVILHHIITDEWSNKILLKEIGLIYNSLLRNDIVPLQDLPIQYSDYALWQRKYLSGENLNRQMEYWKKKLEGSLPLLELPGDRPRPVLQSFKGSYKTYELPSELSGKINESYRKQGVTLFMWLMSILQILLYRLSNQEDICIGTPIANRNRQEVEDLIGFFVNTLVLRCIVKKEMKFTELLKETRQTSFEAYTYQDLPFEMLVDTLQPERNLSHTPLFQVMFVLQNAPLERQKINTGLSLIPVDPVSGNSKFDITMFAQERHDNFKFALEYNSDIFDESTIDTFFRYYQKIIETVLEDPEIKISAISLMKKGDEEELLKQLNSTPELTFKEDCLHRLFEYQAALTPEALALKFKEESMTFSELNEKSNKLAHYMIKRGVKVESRVGISVERSIGMMVSIMAILKAGSCYVPLDINYPKERLKYIAEDSELSLLITTSRILPGFDLERNKIVLIDEDWGEIEKESTGNPEINLHINNLAYIIYTSGSTGRPKGVMIEHRSALNLLETLDKNIYRDPSGVSSITNLQKQRNVSLNASILFDASVQQIVMLLKGHCLCILPEEVRRDGDALMEYIKEQKIDVLDCVPSQLKVLLENGLLKDENDFRPSVILPGGEAIDEIMWKELCESDKVDFYNMYGPTETTVDVTAFHINNSGYRPVIGWPLNNVKFYVVSNDLKLQPLGVKGELCIAGRSLSRGYIGKPDLTAEKFIPDPFSSIPGERLYRTGDMVRLLKNGHVEFVGRIDEQAKIRGYRIELGEIESVLKLHSSIKNAVVEIKENRQKIKHLVAYYEVKNNEPSAADDLKKYLAEKLPEYMIPSLFIMMKGFPLTPNGKIDRKALPEPVMDAAENGTDYVPPQNEIEQILADIWKELLGIDRVSIHDNFFKMGGDSIVGIQFISKARRKGIKVTPLQLFQNQTIEKLAAAAQLNNAENFEQEFVIGESDLTPIQQWFFEQNFENMNHWNQTVLLEVKQHINYPEIRKIIEGLLKHHDVLRSKFQMKDNKWIQVFGEMPEAIPLEYVDISQLDPEEKKSAVEKEAMEIQKSLDIQNGPVFRAAYLNMGGNNTDRIIISIHHLAVDAVSWQVLREDLMILHHEVKAERESRILLKTTSYKKWAEALSEYAQAEQVLNEKDFWLGRPYNKISPLPKDIESSDKRLSNYSIKSISLDQENTGWLLKDLVSENNYQVTDILLTALTLSFSRWTGKRTLLIELESHGREEIKETIDLSRTVGWFTSLYPVLLDLARSISIKDSLLLIREQLRNIPKQGTGFGILKYLSADNETRQRFHEIPQPEVIFNYMGQLAHTKGSTSDTLLAEAKESRGSDRDLNNHSVHLIDINCGIYNETLRIEWTYNSKMFLSETIKSLADTYIKQLEEIISELKKKEEPDYSAAEYPMAKIKKEDLNKVLGKFRK